MVVVALSGCDGSGKTTLALKLEETLKMCGIKVQYRREFEYFILKHLLKLLGKKLDRERKKFLRRESSLTRFDCLKYKLWPFLVWIDSNIEMLYLKLLKKDYLMLLDRSIVDHLTGFEYLKYIDKDMRNLLLRYSIKPNLIIVLDAPPEVMYERKRETHDYRLDFYREQRERYLDIATKLKAPIVRTDKPLNESLREILQYILLRLGKAEDIVLHVLSDPLDDLGVKNFSDFLKNIDWNSLDLGYLIIEASRNNVEFPFYERLHSRLDNNAVRRILRIVEIKHRKFLEVLKSVAELFEGSGIDYVVFKTIPPYKYLPRDIDILVDKKDLKKAINLLISKGFRLTKTHIIHKEVSLVKDDVEVDLHWQIGWMGNRVIDEISILRNSISYKLEDINVRVPDPTHEFLLIATHSILQHHYITLGEVHYIRALIARHDIDYKFVLKLANERDLYTSLAFLLLIVVVKDSLFYRSSIRERIKNINHHLKGRSVSLIKIMKPTIWIDFKSFSLPPTPLNYIDMALTVYRRLRYKLTNTLPYNAPLKDIIALIESYLQSRKRG